MTELEQKAEEYAQNIKYNFNSPFTQISKVAQAYKDGYEQGQQVKSLEVICKDCSIQKQISKQCDSLLKENAELKAQIEKMKCCSNCDNGLRNGLLCDRQIECRKNNNKLWNLAE